MNSATVHTLVNQMGELIHLCAAFQAEYGRGYRLKPGSDQRAWALYDCILRQQVAIAETLDVEALNKPRQIINKWWERMDIPDLSGVTELMGEVSRLIATCAYVEADHSSTDWSYALFCSQTVIAGALHPSAIQIALGNLGTRYAV